MSMGFSDFDHSEFGVVLTACTNPPPQVCPFIVPNKKGPLSPFQLRYFNSHFAVNFFHTFYFLIQGRRNLRLHI